MKSIRYFIPCAALAAAATLFVLRAETNLDSGTPDLNNPDPTVDAPMVTHAICEPLSDTAVNEDGESVPVYAGFEADAEGVYRDTPSVGFQAVITNHPLAEKLEWKVTPLENHKSPNGQGCTAPRILDQLAPTGYLTADAEDDGWVESSFSLAYGAILIDYRYPRPGEVVGSDFEWSARDGDSFEVRCRVKGPEGYYEQPVRWKFHIVPGPKELHIAVSDTGRDTYVNDNANKFEAWTQAKFKTAFSNDQILTPVGSGEPGKFTVFCFDRYRNPLPAGVPVEWQVKGGGSLGTIDESGGNFDVVPGMTDEIANCVTTAAGRAQVGFKQTIYPTCPWSPQFINDLNSSINFIVDEDLSTANRSKLVPDEPEPGLIPKGIRLKWLPITDWVNPKIDKRETRDFEVTAVYVVGYPLTDTHDVEHPLPGADVVWHSVNGTLFPDSFTKTNAQGTARVTLTSSGALKGELLVAAVLNKEREILSPAGARWDTSPEVLFLERERQFIAGDRVVNGTVQIETIDDRGDLLGPEGDGLIEIQVYASSRITIHGVPNHEYTVNAIPVDGMSDQYSRVSYSFESLIDALPGGQPAADRKYSPSECGQHHAEVFNVNNTVAAAAEGKRALIAGSNLADSNGIPITDLPPLEQTGDLNGKIAFAFPPYGTAAVHTLSWTEGAWRLVIGGGAAIFESSAAVASPDEIPAGDWHETTNPHAWHALAGAGVPVATVSAGSFREIIPHADHRIDAGGEVHFADPLAALSVGSPGAGFSLYFAINTPRPQTDESVTLISNKGGASLYLDRIAGTGKCRPRLVFETTIGGVTASRTLLGDEFDDDPQRWFRVRVNAWSNRLVLQTLQSDSYGPNGRIPSGEAAARDQFGHLAGYEAGKVYRLSVGEVFPTAAAAPARINPGQVVSYDLVEFSHDQTPGSSAVAIFEGLTAWNTITTASDGTASFLIKSTGGMNPMDSLGMVIAFEVTGSTTATGHVVVTGSVSQAHMLEMFKAFALGLDGLPPGSPMDHQRIAALISEAVPFWGSGRDIWRWGYKMASGCDEVSGWSVLFHSACFIADAAGAGGSIKLTAKVGLKGKTVLLAMKSFAKTVAFMVILDTAVNTAMKQVASHMQAYGSMLAFESERGQADTSEWTRHADIMLPFVEKRLNDGADSPLNNNFFGAVGGANDCMGLSDMLNEFGEADFESFMSIDPDNPPAE